MAMRKAEMEEHHEAYRALMARAQAAEDQGLYREAMEAALAASHHADGMMQYAKKYQEREFASISAVDLVLRYGPLLLDFKSLRKVESLLDDYRRLTKGTSGDLPGKLAQAISRMWDNHRLWTYLERHPGIRQDGLRQELGGEQEYWRSVAEAWERMGLLRRVPEGGSYSLALATRMGQVVQGKCALCGHIVEAPKGMLLEKMVCPACRDQTTFVIQSAAARPHSVSE